MILKTRLMNNPHQDKTGTVKGDEPSSLQPGEREPVVNTEEQNKPVNAEDRDYKETSNQVETNLNKSDNNPGKTRDDGESGVETPGRSRH
jgi:hypothetical protein